jgi:general stress protein YciG
MTPELRAYFQAMGRKGGKARAAKLSPERRQEIARMGGKRGAETRTVARVSTRLRKPRQSGQKSGKTEPAEIEAT